MKWSWKVGQVAGIAIHLHATFLLLIVWLFISHWRQGNSTLAAFAGLAFIAALFACVLLHELGHALAAKGYGINTRDITLLPIGGIARLERMPEKPKQEFWVALAGPAMNVAIAAVLFVALWATSGLEPLANLSVAKGSFLERLMIVNIFLVVFNLLPAFPMDGGRVLRAFLATRMEYARATQIAAHVGQGMALVFGLIGFFHDPMLMFIALLVWIGAAQEAAAVQMKSAVAGIPVSEVMLTDFQVLTSRDSLSRAVEMILRGSQQDFPVLEDGRMVGLLTRTRLLAALSEAGPESAVSSAMRRGCQSAEPSEMIEVAFDRLQASDCHTIPVMHNERLVGLMTLDNLAEYLMVKAALDAKTSTRLVPRRDAATQTAIHTMRKQDAI